MALRTGAIVSTQCGPAWIYHLTSSRGETLAPCSAVEITRFTLVWSSQELQCQLSSGVLGTDL